MTSTLSQWTKPVTGQTTHDSSGRPTSNHVVAEAEKGLCGSCCLVTGGAGFIGSHLVDALIASGCNVRVLDNFSTGNQRNLEHLAGEGALSLIHGDGADATCVHDAVAGVDFIFHLAAMASVPRSIRQPLICHAWTATSTVQLLEAAGQAGVKRFVLASTSAAYGNSPYVAKRESDPLQPLSPYAAAKLASEQYCLAQAASGTVETVILRYFNVFGPRQDPESEYSAVIPRFVSMILAGQPPVIYGDGGQSRDFIYVRDVADANLLAATTGACSGTVLNIGRGTSTTLLQLLEMLAELLQRPIEPVFESPRPGDVYQSMADASAARNVLGFVPQVTVADGLQSSIDYYRRLVK